MLTLGGLSACGAIKDNPIFQKSTWDFGASNGAKAQNDKAELGLAALAKGDNFHAQGYFESALKANPDDIYALYGLAVLYQNTGQLSHARQYYERILALRPRPQDNILIWADKQTQPIVDVAQVNLQLLGGGSAAPVLQPPVLQPQARQPQARQPQARQSSSASQKVPVASSQLYVRPRTGYGAPPRPEETVLPVFKDGDVNIVERFKTMRALLNQGLITPEEFIARRRANIGALLPLTSKPPAAGLDRPVPLLVQISGRLRALGRALEMRAISPAQHTVERTMILDALMPDKLKTVVQPGLPPQGLLEAADAVRRLEKLKEEDIITSDEYAKERAAIEGAMQSSSAVRPNVGTPAPKAVLSGVRPGVHLASYRQKKAAKRGWGVLRKRFRTFLSKLKPYVERVDLGSRKGVFYRLKAGPLPSNKAAKDLCRKLKVKHQYCIPSTVNLG